MTFITNYTQSIALHSYLRHLFKENPPLHCRTPQTLHQSETWLIQHLANAAGCAETGETFKSALSRALLLALDWFSDVIFAQIILYPNPSSSSVT